MGGGGKGKVEITTYTYRINTAIAICQGPVDRFYRLDYNSDFQLFSNQNSISGPNFFSFLPGENILWGNLHWGNPTDVPDGILTAMHGSNTPYYRGLCYAAFYLDLGASPAMPATAFTVGRWPDVYDDYKYLAYDQADSSYGFNPANLIYDLLTNTDFGFSIDPSLIDVNAFKSVRNVLYTEGLWYSTAIQSGDLYAVIRAVLDWIDGELIYSETTGKIKLVLRRYDYTPATLIEVTASDMRAGTFSLTRTSWESTKNVIYVTFFDVGRECDQNVVYAEDLGNFLMLNTLRVQEFSFDCFSCPTVAQRVANRLLQKHSYPTAKVSFECFASKGEQISVFDPILVTHNYYGISQVFRVIEKRRSGQNLWKFEAIEERFVANSNYYKDQPATTDYDPYAGGGYAVYQHASSWDVLFLETYYRGLLALAYSDDQTTSTTISKILVNAEQWSQVVSYSCIGRVSSALGDSDTDVDVYITPDIHYTDDITEVTYFLIGNEIFYAYTVEPPDPPSTTYILKVHRRNRAIEGTSRASHSVNAKVYDIVCKAMTSSTMTANTTYDLVVTPWYSSPLPYYDSDRAKTKTVTYHNYIAKPYPPKNLNSSGSSGGSVSFTWEKDNRVATDTSDGAPAFPVPCEGLTQYPMTYSGGEYYDQIVSWRLDFCELYGTTPLLMIYSASSPTSYTSPYAERSVAGLCNSFTMYLYSRGINGLDGGPISRNVY